MSQSLKQNHIFEFSDRIHIFPISEEEKKSYNSFQRIKSHYPDFSLEIFVNTPFLKYLKQHSKTREIFYLPDASDTPYLFGNSQKIKTLRPNQINGLFLNTCHYFTRVAFQTLPLERKQNTTIVHVDAHYDLSNQENDLDGHDNKWILPKWAKQSILIGGWDEKSHDKHEATKFLAHYPSIEDFLSDATTTQKKLISRYVFLTIDLDFFSTEKEINSYCGIPNYWHRMFWIGHAKTFKQLLDLKYSKRILTNPWLLLEDETDYNSVKEFRQKRINSILEKIATVEKHIFDLLHVLNEDLECDVFYCDFAEFSHFADIEDIAYRSLLTLMQKLEKNFLPSC